MWLSRAGREDLFLCCLEKIVVFFLLELCLSVCVCVLGVAPRGGLGGVIGQGDFAIFLE